MKPPTKFTSVHDYLDECFDGKQASKEEIMHAKKVYWRAYNSDLKRRSRKERPILHLSFSKREYQMLKEQKPQNMKLYQFVRELVLQSIGEAQNFSNSLDQALIEEHLLSIRDHLVELVEMDQIGESQWEQLRHKMERLEQFILAL